ncbi:cupin domain-containing protein [Mycolicibacterium elephantis]|uniref:cupin domain-containing protein n=1 Tax=Mycolicibacterium elephantis TaxID=81858 RepID=UPI0007EA8BD0|nr:cupin domain-containing protein [Mycolicibacterium elephantis]OBA68481.1 cupin [Mycolicibacterium elephantis]OBE98778.1 cupin [Mycolicibacterium elephantis]
MSVPDGAVLKVVPVGDGEVVDIPGFGAVFKLTSSTTGGLVSIVEHPFPVGAITAAHRHANEDEHSYVLEGEIGFRSDDSEVVLGPGGYITKPRGQMHAMWNAGPAPGRIIEVIAPGGFENYFRELGELLTSGTAVPDPTAPLHETAEFADLAKRYGLTYGTPDWLDDVVRRYGLSPATH